MMGGWMMAGFGSLLLLAVGLAVALLLRPTPGAGRGILRPSAKESLDQRRPAVLTPKTSDRLARLTEEVCDQPGYPKALDVDLDVR